LAQLKYGGVENIYKYGTGNLAEGLKNLKISVILFVLREVL
jgi:hypothetical protein